jgi:uncharacterized protein with ACT and thioredoxin-like domain
MSETASRRSSEEVNARDVVEAVDTLRKLVRQYGYVAIAIFTVGGGAAVFTIPARLAKVEQDHVSIRRHQTRMEAGQDWLICVVAERNKEGGSIDRCDSLRPRPTSSHGDDLEEDTQ